MGKEGTVTEQYQFEEIPLTKAGTFSETYKLFPRAQSAVKLGHLPRITQPLC